MLVAGISVLVLGVQLTAGGMVAILAIGIGIMSLVLVRGNDGLRNGRAATMALITGCFIAGYSLVDGYGARQAGTALGFFGWLSIVNTIVFSLVVSAIKPGLLRCMGGSFRQSAITVGSNSGH